MKTFIIFHSFSDEFFLGVFIHYKCCVVQSDSKTELLVRACASLLTKAITVYTRDRWPYTRSFTRTSDSICS